MAPVEGVHETSTTALLVSVSANDLLTTTTDPGVEGAAEALVEPESTNNSVAVKAVANLTFIIILR
jgi:hypothetical protein